MMVTLWFSKVSSTLLNSLSPNSSTLLNHLARFSLACSGLDFLLKMSTNCRKMSYACSSLGKSLKRILALRFCCSFHLDLCLSMMCLLRAMICGRVSPFSILFGSHAPMSSLSSFVRAALRASLCSRIALFSASSTSQR